MQFNTKEERKAHYIGDGLYVDFDGYSIWLKANNYERPTDTIALEPEVFNALVKYVERLKNVQI